MQLPPLSLEHPLDPAPPPPNADDASWDDVTNERTRDKRAAPAVPGAAEGDADGAPTATARGLGATVDGRHGAPRVTTSEVEAMASISISNLVEVRSGSRDGGSGDGAITGPRPAVSPEGRALDAHVDRMFEAERCFRRGNRSLAKGEHRDALAAFDRAVELCPEEGEFVAYLGWARYCTDPTSYPTTENALADLERAIGLAPDLHLTHLLHARVLDHAGRDARALAAYREVLALEPSMDEALEAVARLGRSGR